MNQAPLAIGHLLLENGTSFYGTSIGARTTSAGKSYVFAEVVFNTSMSGYQEILTDPSYLHQIITFTYPEIGNYGVHPMHKESSGIQASGMLARRVHNYKYAHLTQPNIQSQDSKQGKVIPTHTCLKQYLKDQQIIALEGLDTRKLTRILRSSGVMRGVLSSHQLSEQEGKELLAKLPKFENKHMPREVTCKQAYTFNAANEDEKINTPIKNNESNRPTIGVIDYGVKTNILRILNSHGMDVQVFPCNTTAETLLKANLSGILLSNGPGNPAICTEEVATIKNLIGKLPIFGICLGHQLLALALGGSTTKLMFGHRGANHPIQSRDHQKIDITSQNHGYAVEFPASKHEENPQKTTKNHNSLIAKHTENPQKTTKNHQNTPKNHQNTPKNYRNVLNPNAKALGIFLQQETLSHINLNDFTIAGYKHETAECFAVQHHPEASPGPHDSYYLFTNFCNAAKRFFSVSKKTSATSNATSSHPLKRT